MSWTTIDERRPPVDMKVLVWRRKNKKYTVARLSLIRSQIDDDNYEAYEGWVSEHGSIHPLHNEDQWLKFEYVTVTTTDVYN